MRQNQVNNVNYLKDRRRELRSNLTPAEATLWKALKGSKVNDKKFRRQHSIGNYIVDFYCPSARLIIELDGQVHNDPMQAVYDAERDEWLKAMGNTILRFENKLVLNNLQGIPDEIERHFSLK
jgi:very-short-patch-repair endonuclease